MPEFQEGNDDRRATLIITQPPHYPTMHTRETVTHLVAFGLVESQIAVILRCTVDDVKRHYKEELEHGLTMVNSRVMGAVLHSALYKDSAPDRKLWLMNRAGWKGGDGPRALALNLNQNGEPVGEGVLTVVERREVITRVLSHATQAKRLNESVIEGETVKKPNGNGSNGHGNGSGNGANGKHR